MKKYFALLFLLFLCNKIFSQNTLSGSVTDSTFFPLSYATVALYINDTLINGSITNETGFFKLENIKSGKYILKINYIGYALYKNETEITQNLNLGNIMLTMDSKLIEEINIIGKKTNTKTEADRLVYEVSASEIKNAVNVYQVLINVPELQVNPLQKTASVIGAENTLLLINGVKRDEGALLGIDPKNIQKVEVISNPSARYLSSDVTGVINIITKEKASGYVGGISEMITPNLKTNGWTDFNFSYNKKKISFYSFGFLSFLNENKSQDNLITKTHINEDIFQKETKSIYNQFKMSSGDITGGCEINFNEKNHMLVDARLGGFLSNGSTGSDGIYSENSVFQHNYQIVKQTSGDEIRQKYSIYYQYKPDDKGTLLAIEGNYNVFIDNYLLSYTDESINSLYVNNMQSRSLKNSFDLQADYSRSFGNLKGEGGYRIYFQDVEQNLDYKSQNNISNFLFFKELKNYFYLNFNGKISENLTYQTGIGGEFTNTVINSDVTDTINNNYFKALPALGFMYKINKKNSLKLNYLSSLSRPSISNLNPTVRYVDSLKVISGNPYLEPYYTNRLNLKYTLSLKKLYISPSITYSYIPNNIVSFGQTDNSGIYRASFKNIANYNYFQTTFDFNYTILTDLKLNANVFYRFVEYNDSYNSIQNEKGSVGYSVSTNFNYKDLTFYFAYNRKPEYLSGNTIGRSADDSWLSVSWSINDNWNIGANARYLLLWKSMYNINDKNYYEYYESFKNDRHFQILIEISYTFEKGNKFDKKRKKISNTDSSEGLEL